MAGASRKIVINAPPEKVFAVVTDYANYAELFSEVRKVHTSNRQGHEIEVNYEVEILKAIRYTLRMKEEPPNKVSWTFVKGDFMRDNKGSWLLEPRPDGSTEVTYTIEVTLGPLVPKTLVTALVDNSLPKMLEAVKERVERAG